MRRERTTAGASVPSLRPSRLCGEETLINRRDAKCAEKAATTIRGLTLADATLIVRSLFAFAIEHRGSLYEGWPGHVLFRYLAWHFCARQVCAAYCKAFHEIRGFLIAWPDDSTQIADREARGLPHFDWQLRSGGDAGILAEVITHPQDRAHTVRRLEQLATARWPDWKLRKLFTWRHKRLVEVDPRALARVLTINHQLPNYQPSTNGRSSISTKS